MQPRRALSSALAAGSLALILVTAHEGEPATTVLTSGSIASHGDPWLDRSRPGTAPSRPTSSLPPTTATSTTEVAVPSSTTTTQPPPTTASPPPTAPPTTNSSTVIEVIRAAFAPYGQAAIDTAIRVARCESNLVPTAVNRSSGASGLFQVMPGWANEYEAVTGVPFYDGRFDPRANARFAVWLAYEANGGGWGHWVCH